MEHRFLTVWSELEYDSTAAGAAVFIVFVDPAAEGRPVQVGGRQSGK